MSDPGRAEEKFEERHGAERWILPYFEDSALLPVLLVVLAHVAAFAAGAILMAVRDRLPIGILGTFLLVIGSLMAIRWEWRMRGGFRAFTWSILGTWLTSGAMAWAGWHYGFF